MQIVNGQARRDQVALNTPAELAIRNAMTALNDVDASHPFLTEVAVMLEMALNQLADYVELTPAELEPWAEESRKYRESRAAIKPFDDLWPKQLNAESSRRLTIHWEKCKGHTDFSFGYFCSAITDEPVPPFPKHNCQIIYPST